MHNINKSWWSLLTRLATDTQVVMVLFHLFRDIMVRVWFARLAGKNYRMLRWLWCWNSRCWISWCLDCWLASRWRLRWRWRWSIWRGVLDLRYRLKWNVLLYGHKDFRVITLNLALILSGYQHFHHAELFVLLRSHGHELLSLHPARLSLHAWVNRAFLFVFKFL